MAAVKRDNTSVKLNGHHTTLRSIKTKFESLHSTDNDTKRTFNNVASQQYASLTLGRKPSRSGSFSFQKSKDVPDISVTPTRQLFLRDRDNRCSSRSLGNEMDSYDSATLSTPPRPVRRQKRIVTTPSLIPVPTRTLDKKKLKDKLSRKPSPIFTTNSTPSFLTPAQSLTNLSTTSYPVSPVRKSPIKATSFPSSVYNLSIAPSIHNVSLRCFV